MTRVLWLLAFALANSALGQPVGDTRGGDSSSRKPPSEQGASAPRVSTSAEMLPLVERITRAQEAQAANGKTSAEEQREKDDLIAQQEMAVWAKCMFYATVLAIIVSSGGTYLLIQTIRETRRSTRVALRSVAVGRRAVRVAKESAEKQLRAYVMVERWKIDTKTNGLDKPMVRLIFKNVGQTPAYGFRVPCSMSLCKTGDKSEVIVSEKSSGSASTLYPQGAVAVNKYIERAFTQDECFGLKYGLNLIQVQGEAKFRDAFGKARSLSFKFIAHAMNKVRDPDGSEEFSLSVAEDGNDDGDDPAQQQGAQAPAASA